MVTYAYGYLRQWLLSPMVTYAYGYLRQWLLTPMVTHAYGYSRLKGFDFDWFLVF